MGGALSFSGEVEMWVEVGCTNESLKGRAHRFKPRRVRADWLKDGRQEDDWINVMTSLTVW